MNDIIEELNEKLIDYSYSKKQIEEIDTILRMVMHKYEISKKETSITVYTGDYDLKLIKKFLATKMVAGCTKRTIGMYQQALMFIKNRIQKPFIDITCDDILYYFAIRNTVDKVSAVTQNNELRVLGSFYNFLMDDEKVKSNPTRKINKIKGEQKVKEAFTETELERMRAACNTRKGFNYKHAAIIEVLISTGCRATELCNIKMTDIDGNKIKILGKGNKERWVYLSPRAMISLENYYKVRKSESPYLFTGQDIKTKQETERMNNQSLNCLLKKIAKRAGVEGCHTHKFRRTAATLALRRGMPIEMVSKMLGHQQISTTQIYLQITDDDLAAAHKKYC